MREGDRKRGREEGVGWGKRVLVRKRGKQGGWKIRCNKIGRRK